MKVGVALAYVMGSLTTTRNLNIFGAAITICYLAISLFLPETPVYLLKKGKINEAKKVLKFLRKNNHDIEKELEELKEEGIFLRRLKICEDGQKIATEDQENFLCENRENSKQSENILNQNSNKFEIQATKNSFKTQLKNVATRRAFIIVIVLFMLFQGCGINPILYYSSKILIESEINLDKFSCSLLLGIVQVIGVILAMPLLDYKGRKFLLLSSFVIMALGQLSNGIYFHLKSLDFDVSNIKWIPLVSMSTFLLGINAGLAPVTYIFMGELFSIQAKKVFAPLGMTSNLFLAFVVTLAFPFLSKAIGIHLILYFFTFSCFFGFIFTWKFVPETKGKSLNEIQRILEGN